MNESSVTTLTNPAVLQTSPVSQFSTRLPIEDTSATLNRTPTGVELTLDTEELPEGAYSLWWVIFNNPEFCVDGCGSDDFEVPSVNASVFWATGETVGDEGIGNFSAQLLEGKLPNGPDQVLFGNGLVDSFSAEVHPVLRSHGPVIPGQEAEQITTFNGGCPPNECENVQFAIFPSVPVSEPLKVRPNQGQIVVANRASGNLSILNESTGTVLGTVDLPAGPGNRTGEPTYISNLNRTGEIAVADRANNQVVFFDRTTYRVTGTVATGAGNFHMWVDLKETQLWVVNDIDNALTVIDPKTKTEVERVQLSKLIGPNAKPHDVILDPAGQYAYVTILQGDNPDNDLLLKIDTQNFEVVDTAEVGKDPHVSLAPEHNLLYVLAQNSDRIDIFDRRGSALKQVSHLDQPGAHGVTASADGQYLYTTNLPGGGDNGLFVIDTVTNTIVGNHDGVDTPFPVPHNVAVTNDGERLFVTHSGTDANAISVYSLDDPALPIWESSVNGQGLNPFGLAYVPSSHDELFVSGDKDDVLKLGGGNDTVFGGAGDDVLQGQGGNDKLLGEAGDDRLRGNHGDDVLIGGLGNDDLNGGKGNDLLIGSQVESLEPGKGEVDTLKGGKGADTFVLGDGLSVHYDDGDALSIGFGDYALIKDFKLNQQDVIRLHGNAELYELGAIQGNTGIFYKPLDQTAELIGVVQGITGLDLTSNAFEYATV